MCQLWLYFLPYTFGNFFRSSLISSGFFFFFSTTWNNPLYVMEDETQVIVWSKEKIRWVKSGLSNLALVQQRT